MNERLAGLLQTAETRGGVKRVGKLLDSDPALRSLAVAELAKRGIEGEGPGKKLVRRLLNRDGSAQVRARTIALDESFECVECGGQVQPGGAFPRDHCPHCLVSLHVDVIPGDRAAGCGGVLDPKHIEMQGEKVIIVYGCRRCGTTKRNKALRHGDQPDDWERIVAISSRS